MLNRWNWVLETSNWVFLVYQKQCVVGVNTHFMKIHRSCVSHQLPLLSPIRLQIRTQSMSSRHWLCRNRGGGSTPLVTKHKVEVNMSPQKSTKCSWMSKRKTLNLVTNREVQTAFWDRLKLWYKLDRIEWEYHRQRYNLSKITQVFLFIKGIYMWVLRNVFL